MRVSEWYDSLNDALTDAGFTVKWRQPQPTDTLPLVHVSARIDSDASTHNGTLNTIEQQIDYYDETTTARADFENAAERLKHAISTTGRWDSLTTKMTVDDSTGRDVYRAMLIVTITI